MSGGKLAGVVFGGWLLALDFGSSIVRKGWRGLTYRVSVTGILLAGFPIVVSSTWHVIGCFFSAIVCAADAGFGDVDSWFDRASMRLLAFEEGMRRGCCQKARVSGKIVGLKVAQTCNCFGVVYREALSYRGLRNDNGNRKWLRAGSTPSTEEIESKTQK